MTMTTPLLASCKSNLVHASQLDQQRRSRPTFLSRGYTLAPFVKPAQEKLKRPATHLHVDDLYGAQQSIQVNDGRGTYMCGQGSASATASRGPSIPAIFLSFSYRPISHCNLTHTTEMVKCLSPESVAGSRKITIKHDGEGDGETMPRRCSSSRQRNNNGKNGVGGFVAGNSAHGPLLTNDTRGDIKGDNSAMQDLENHANSNSSSSSEAFLQFRDRGGASNPIVFNQNFLEIQNYVRQPQTRWVLHFSIEEHKCVGMEPTGLKFFIDLLTPRKSRQQRGPATAVKEKEEEGGDKKNGQDIVSNSSKKKFGGEEEGHEEEGSDSAAAQRKKRRKRRRNSHLVAADRVVLWRLLDDKSEVQKSIFINDQKVGHITLNVSWKYSFVKARTYNYSSPYPENSSKRGHNYARRRNLKQEQTTPTVLHRIIYGKQGKEKRFTVKSKGLLCGFCSHEAFPTICGLVCHMRFNHGLYEEDGDSNNLNHHKLHANGVGKRGGMEPSTSSSKTIKGCGEGGGGGQRRENNCNKGGVSTGSEKHQPSSLQLISKIQYKRIDRYKYIMETRVNPAVCDHCDDEEEDKEKEEEEEEEDKAKKRERRKQNARKAKEKKDKNNKRATTTKEPITTRRTRSSRRRKRGREEEEAEKKDRETEEGGKGEMEVDQEEEEEEEERKGDCPASSEKPANESSDKKNNNKKKNNHQDSSSRDVIVAPSTSTNSNSKGENNGFKTNAKKKRMMMNKKEKNMSSSSSSSSSSPPSSSARKQANPRRLQLSSADEQQQKQGQGQLQTFAYFNRHGARCGLVQKVLREAAMPGVYWRADFDDYLRHLPKGSRDHAAARTLRHLIEDHDDDDDEEEEEDAVAKDEYDDIEVAAAPPAASSEHMLIDEDDNTDDDEDEEDDRGCHNRNQKKKKKNKKNGSMNKRKMIKNLNGGRKANDNAVKGKMKRKKGDNNKKKKKKKKKKAERKISNFFHASDTTPCYEDELDIDSDDEYEVDDEWLREQQKQSIEELEELSQSEQLFAIQWNDFVHKHHVYADFVFPLMCEIFANEHGKWLIEKRLRTNFLLHLMTMWEWRLVSSRTIQKCMLIVDSSGADIVAPAKDLNAFVKDVSSSTSSSTSSSSLSKRKKEERTANRPKVTRSRAKATR
eukprot:jgi/Bigna1/83436/fgenesh1_pg.108_\